MGMPGDDRSQKHLLFCPEDGSLQTLNAQIDASGSGPGESSGEVMT